MLRSRTRWVILCWATMVLTIYLAMAPAGHSQPVVASPTVFYLHTAYIVGLPSQRILSTDPPYGFQRLAQVQEITVFVLHPFPGRLVRIGGTVTFSLWFRASSATIGIVNATLVEVTSDGRTFHLCGIEAPVLIEPALKEQPHVFSVGPVTRTVKAGSTIVLQVVVKEAKAPIFLYWDDSRTPSHVALPFVERYYYVMNLIAKDFSNREMKGANMTVMRNSTKVWTGVTGTDGAVGAILPSTEDSDLYSVQVYWKGTIVNETQKILLTADRELALRCEVYDLAVMVQDLFGLPFAQMKVDLLTERGPMTSNNTRPDGLLTFSQIPKGDYALVFNYDSSQHVRKGIIVSGSTRYVATLQILPAWFYYVILVFTGILAGSALLFSRRSRKPRKTSFSLLNELLGGDAPVAVAVMLIGPPGSGKTVLMQKMMYDQLTGGKSCVFVTNNDFPRKIVEDMRQLGLDVSRFEGRQLAFVDCYSGTAGMTSSEKYSVQALTDLTSLGTQMSGAASALGQGTMFYLDSLAPLFTSLKPDPIMTFIHATGARTKGQGGSLFFSVGTGLDRDILTRLEGLSDCIVEFGTFERGGVPVRRIRIKKIRGRKHPWKWIEFSIEAPDGIVFYR